MHCATPAFRDAAFSGAERDLNDEHTRVVHAQLRDSIFEGTRIHAEEETDTLFSKTANNTSVPTELVQKARAKSFCREYVPQQHDLATLVCDHSKQRSDYLVTNLEALLRRVPLGITVGEQRVHLEPYQRLAIASSATTLPVSVSARASVMPDQIADIQSSKRRRSSRPDKDEDMDGSFLHASVQLPANEMPPVELVTYLNRSGKAAITVLSFLLWNAFPTADGASLNRSAAQNNAFRRSLGMPQEVDDSAPPAPVMIVVCGSHKRARWLATARGAVAEVERVYGMHARVWDSSTDGRVASLLTARRDQIPTVWVLERSQVTQAMTSSPRVAFMQLVLVEGACSNLPKWCSPFVKLSVVASTPCMLSHLEQQQGAMHPLRELLGGCNIWTLYSLRDAVAKRQTGVARAVLSHWCIMSVLAPPPFMLDCVARGVAKCMPETLAINTIICARNSVQDRTIGGFARVDFVELLEMLSEASLDRETKLAIRHAIATESSHSVERLAQLLEGVVKLIFERTTLGSSSKATMAANVRRLKERFEALMNTSDMCPVCWEPMSTSGAHVGRILSCCTCVVCEECVPSLSRCPTCRSQRKAAASVSSVSPTEQLRDSLSSMSMDEALEAIGKARLTKSEAVRAIISDVIRPKRPNATVLLLVAASDSSRTLVPLYSESSMSSFSVRFVEDLRKELPAAKVTCSRAAMGWPSSSTQAHAVTESHLIESRFKDFESPTPTSPLQVLMVNASSSASADAIPVAEFTILCDDVEPGILSRALGSTLAPRSDGSNAQARAIVIKH